MSIFSVQARKHTAFYDNLMSASVSRTPGRERAAAEPPFLGTRDTSSSESASEVSRSSEKSHINRTHVVSAMSRGSGQPYRGRLTLQRRSRRKTGADRTREDTGTESSHNNTSPAPERKRLTLQRRTRTPSMMDQTKSGQQQQPTSKVLSEPNGRTPGSLFRSASLREAAPKLSGAPGAQTQRESASSSSARTLLLEPRAHTFNKTPTRKTPFEKIASKRDVFEKLSSKEAPKPVVHRSAGVERPQTRVHQPVAAPRVSKASAPGAHRPNTGLQDSKATSSSSAKPEATSEPTLVRTSEGVRQQDSLKMENSAVTVAVRVRPFSSRCVLCGLHKTSSERAHTQLLLFCYCKYCGSTGVKPP